MPVEVLVLNGSPGAGKSTVANAVSEELRNENQTHVVIDVDELARAYPETLGDVMWSNLAAVWRNYSSIPGVKVILPMLIDDQESLAILKDILACDTFQVCELTASTEVLELRVTDREPNEYWKNRLRRMVYDYAAKPMKFSDFQVSTETFSPEQAASKIVARLGWSSQSLIQSGRGETISTIS